MSQDFIPGFGAALAAAREAKGLTTAEVAERLKLTVRQIEAIETEDWSNLPAPVFVRGFVRNYAKLVDVAMDTLVRPVAPAETATQTITAPSAGVRLGKSPVARWLLLPVLLVFLFIAVVSGLYTWLSRGEETLVTATPQPQSSLPSAEPGPAVAPAMVAETRPTPPIPTQTPQAPTPEIVRPDAAPPVQTPTPTPVPQTTALPTPEPAATGSASMKFSPQEDAWIQVVDGKGMRFSKLVRAGSTEVVTGTPPFRLVVGNAANVSLTYNGHAIDLKPFIGEKVARLTLE